MTGRTPPNIDIPPGWKLVPDNPPLGRTIAFRVTTDQEEILNAFRRTFPTRSWGESLRWLVDQPVVLDLIRTRIAVLADGPADDDDLAAGDDVDDDEV